MKKIALLIIAILAMLISSCDNIVARRFGGEETINLPPGKRLVSATWKETDLWYVVEDMPEGYKPGRKEFVEKSTSGVWEGKVIFIESAK